jgi:hypothetical protein
MSIDASPTRADVEHRAAGSRHVACPRAQVAQRRLDDLGTQRVEWNRCGNAQPKVFSRWPHHLHDGQIAGSDGAQARCPGERALRGGIELDADQDSQRSLSTRPGFEGRRVAHDQHRYRRRLSHPLGDAAEQPAEVLLFAERGDDEQCRLLSLRDGDELLVGRADGCDHIDVDARSHSKLLCQLRQALTRRVDEGELGVALVDDVHYLERHS